MPSVGSNTPRSVIKCMLTVVQLYYCCSRLAASDVLPAVAATHATLGRTAIIQVWVVFTCWLLLVVRAVFETDDDAKFPGIEEGWSEGLGVKVATGPGVKKWKPLPLVSVEPAYTPLPTKLSVPTDSRKVRFYFMARIFIFYIFLFAHGAKV